MSIRRQIEIRHDGPPLYLHEDIYGELDDKAKVFEDYCLYMQRLGKRWQRNELNYYGVPASGAAPEISIQDISGDFKEYAGKVVLISVPMRKSVVYWLILDYSGGFISLYNRGADGLGDREVFLAQAASVVKSYQRIDAEEKPAKRRFYMTRHGWLDMGLADFTIKDSISGRDAARRFSFEIKAGTDAGKMPAASRPEPSALDEAATAFADLQFGSFRKSSWRKFHSGTLSGGEYLVAVMPIEYKGHDNDLKCQLDLDVRSVMAARGGLVKTSLALWTDGRSGDNDLSAALGVWRATIDGMMVVK